MFALSRLDRGAVPRGRLASLTGVRPWLLAIVILALAVRLALVLRAGERPLVGDEISYDTIAYNLATGHGYTWGDTDASRTPTTARGPSYIVYLAAFYRIAGHREVPPLVGQCCIEALSCLLAFWIGRRLFASEGTGLIAAALYAVYPPFIINSGQLITESLTNVTFLGIIASFLRFVDRRRIGDIVLVGLALGICGLSKPQVLPVGVLLPLAAIPVIGGRRAVASALGIVAMTTIVMTPWIVRNAVVFHRFMPAVSLGGFAFWGGTAPFGGIHTIGGLSDPAVPDSVRQQTLGMNEIELNSWFVHDAMRVIRDDPWRYARLSIRKFSQLWLNIGYGVPPSRATLALAAYNIGCFALALRALLKRRSGPLPAAILWSVGTYWTIVNVSVCTIVRYSMPFYALMFCYTAAGVESLFPFGLPGQERRTPHSPERGATS